jgi:hypothetical protein
LHRALIATFTAVPAFSPLPQKEGTLKQEKIMNKLITIGAMAAATLAFAASGASAAVVCNEEGDCWHVRGEAKYKPEFKLHVYGDDWKFTDKNHRWREHEGRGYWKSGVWIGID